MAELNIKVEKNEEVLTIKVSGRLDATNASNLDNEVEKISNIKELVFDLENLAYISSAGLRVILSASKKMMELGSMKIKNVSDSVMEVFEITGFTDILTIE